MKPQCLAPVVHSKWKSLCLFFAYLSVFASVHQHILYVWRLFVIHLGIPHFSEWLFFLELKGFASKCSLRRYIRTISGYLFNFLWDPSRYNSIYQSGFYAAVYIISFSYSIIAWVVRAKQRANGNQNADSVKGDVLGCLTLSPCLLLSVSLSLSRFHLLSSLNFNPIKSC